MDGQVFLLPNSFIRIFPFFPSSKDVILSIDGVL